MTITSKATELRKNQTDVERLLMCDFLFSSPLPSPAGEGGLPSLNRTVLLIAGISPKEL